MGKHSFKEGDVVLFMTEYGIYGPYRASRYDEEYLVAGGALFREDGSNSRNFEIVPEYGMTPLSELREEKRILDDTTQALNRQIGGTHYNKLAIQPIEYCHANNLGPCETYAIKYITRHGSKNGREDIQKAIHVLELLLELEYAKQEE